MTPIDLDIDVPDYPEFPDAPTRGADEGKYSEYQWAFRTNEKNPKITVFKKQGETSTELGWSIVPLNEERTLWILPTHYWDYAASEYDFYYESDTCERYLIEAFLKSENFDKPFNGEQITYNGVTYNLVVDRYHDYISNIIYPDNTQYNIMDNNAVHLTGDETIIDIKRFASGFSVKNTGVKGTAPSSTLTRQMQFCDTNNVILGTVYNTYITSKDVTVGLSARKANAASDNEVAYLSLHYNANGDKYVAAPSSDINGSIVTTVNKSKAINGYFQLGNGLIINWGALSFSGSSNTGSVTFSKSFTSNPKIMITRNSGDTTANDGGDYYTRKITTTGFEIYRTSTNTGGCQWLAIGY